MEDGYFRGKKMIFVTLGTQDKSFHRLLDELQKMVDEKIITEKIIIQAGKTKFSSESMEIFDFVDMDQFLELIKECSILISHGGVGSIISGLNEGKKVIAIARLEKYGEHENDHQVQIVKQFMNDNYILGCLDVRELRGKWEHLRDFNPLPYKSNNELFCNLIQKLIDE